MDKSEFTRRIEIYLELDSPDLSGRADVARRLGERLFQYVRQDQPSTPTTASRTLLSLLPDTRVLLLFTASWDGSAPGYASVVDEAARRLGAAVIEVDVDDPIGSAITRLFHVLNTPAVVDARSSTAPIVGSRSVEEIVAAFETG